MRLTFVAYILVLVIFVTFNGGCASEEETATPEKLPNINITACYPEGTQGYGVIAWFEGESNFNKPEGKEDPIGTSIFSFSKYNIDEHGCFVGLIDPNVVTLGYYFDVITTSTKPDQESDWLNDSIEPIKVLYGDVELKHGQFIPRYGWHYSPTSKIKVRRIPQKNETHTHNLPLGKLKSECLLDESGR